MSINRNDIRKTPRVVVEWVDSTEDTGWRAADDIGPPLTIMTTGYLVRKTREATTIAHSVSTSGRVLGALIIPNGCIVRTRSSR